MPIDTESLLLDIVKEVSVIKTTTKNTEDKLDGYCSENTRQHNRMWKKIDFNSRIIYGFLGAVAFIGIVARLQWQRIKGWF